MPFGLKNATQMFQRLMDHICTGMDFVFVHLDDVLIASCTKDEHKEHLTKLFPCLSDHGLVKKPVKCQFGVSCIE